MARQDYGDELETPIQQPGGKLSNDGYGLLTATVVWKANADNDLSVGNRGSTCPINAALAAHKFAVTYDALGVATITVDYIGIDPTINEGSYTNPQVGSSNGLTSQPITTNPNFFENAGSGYYEVIAGATYEESDKGPQIIRADGNKGKSYVGENGACFERPDGGRFIGFVDPAFKKFYGKTNYLAPQTSFSGHFYTSEEEKVQDMISALNTTAATNDWEGTLPKIIPDYAGTYWNSGTLGDGDNQLLLAQVNVEDYGLLFKVNYEVRYSLEGWPAEVYPSTPTA
jgi:hypothetical protein